MVIRGNQARDSDQLFMRKIGWGSDVKRLRQPYDVRCLPEKD